MRIQREGTIQSHPAAIGDPGAGAVTMEGLIIGQWSLVRPAHKMLTSVWEPGGEMSHGLRHFWLATNGPIKLATVSWSVALAGLDQVSLLLL